MESPTRISQSRFFRFGRTSKTSRKSTSGYSTHSYAGSQHPVEVASSDLHHHLAHPVYHHQQHNGEEPIYSGSDIYQQLNHRSASMSMLPSNMTHGAYTPLPFGEDFGMGHQPRLSQLQTLEAKMASIASSLSNGTGGGIGRRTGASSSASLDVARTGSSKVSSASHSTASSSRSKHVRNEIELLRKIIQDKDAVIQRLQKQQQQNNSNGMASMASTLPVNGVSRATSNERQQIERRLGLINRDIEHKKGSIKSLRLTLQQTNVSDNIDSRIKQAETEYQLEREETNLLNLQDEKRNLLLRFSGTMQRWGRGDSRPDDVGHGNGNRLHSSLFRILQGRLPFLMVLDQVDYSVQNPCFKLHCDCDNDNNDRTTSLDTCTVQWARDGLRLKTGDKVLEINGHLIPGQEKTEVTKLLVPGPMEVVVARQSSEEIQLAKIEELTGKLEELNHEYDSIKGENQRLQHRISYLEEMHQFDDLRDVMGDGSHGSRKVSGASERVLSSADPKLNCEVRAQEQHAPTRQKPPRNSKQNRTTTANILDHDSAYNSSTPRCSDQRHQQQTMRHSAAVDGSVLSPDTVDTVPQDESVGRIKPPIVDKHFGHVIRVTHHHHPPLPQPTTTSSLSRRPPIADSVSVLDLSSVVHDSFADQPTRHGHANGHTYGHGHYHYQQLNQPVHPQSSDKPMGSTASSVSLSLTRHFGPQRSPPSPTRSEVQSVVSMDLDRRHLGYMSDEQSLDHRAGSPTSIHNYGDLVSNRSYKKPAKPVPPRKPSFLYLNRASSLQSVNGVVKASNHSIDRLHSGKQGSSSSRHQRHAERNNATDDESWSISSSNTTTNIIDNTTAKSSLRNLKWSILSSTGKP